MRAQARQLGFLDARVTGAVVPSPAGAAYVDWVAQGYHGEMDYMARLQGERASGVEHILPGARSVIVLACSYYWPDTAGATVTGGSAAVKIARYALGKDYHYVLRERLEHLVTWLDNAMPGESWRICVDSAPLLERAYAAAAGIGFIGKNSMIISWMGGSYTLLAEILTTAELPQDEPRPGSCGNCTRCLDACPTQAFATPGVVDSRRCISYLTIEKKSELTGAEAAMTGEWLFGCDICQQVCPYNKHPDPSRMYEFRPGTVVERREPVGTFLEPASNSQFERRFAESPILRAGRRRIQRLARNKAEADDKNDS